MIYWLDNQENHKRAVNENWGRELEPSAWQATIRKRRAKPPGLTGWGSRRNSRLPPWALPWEFEYNAEDHDETEKEFGAQGQLQW